MAGLLIQTWEGELTFDQCMKYILTAKALTGKGIDVNFLNEYLRKHAKVAQG